MKYYQFNKNTTQLFTFKRVDENFSVRFKRFYYKQIDENNKQALLV